MKYKLPPLPEPTALGMDFDKGWDGIRAYGYTEDDMQAYAIAAIEAQGVPDEMPTSAVERHLRRLLAVRVGMPNTYFDDGEAHGAEHGISIDFLREPVAHIDAKLRALNVARAECAPQVERCNVCNYQHGHQIGCKNNPVDIALKAKTTVVQNRAPVFCTYPRCQSTGNTCTGQCAAQQAPQASRVQKWPVSQDHLTQLQVASIISERDAAPQAERTLLEQYDLEQSPDYRKGWDDGRKKGYEVGVRHGKEQHLFSQASVVQQEPLGFISPKQVERIVDPDGEFGAYIPMRKTPAGNFTLAVYTHPAQQAKPQS